MMVATFHPTGSLSPYTYVTILSAYEGKILLSRHGRRTTWEQQGGHIEPGETPLQAARRELYEECGALEYTLHELCDYSALGTHGRCYFADIARLGPLPESEMAEVRTFAALPENLTYPGVTPGIFERCRHLFPL